MQKVENSMFVSVAYTGTLDNDEVFDSSEGRPPPRNPMAAGPAVTAVRAAAADITFWGLEPHSDRLKST